MPQPKLTVNDERGTDNHYILYKYPIRLGGHDEIVLVQAADLMRNVSRLW